VKNHYSFLSFIFQFQSFIFKFQSSNFKSQINYKKKLQKKQKLKFKIPNNKQTPKKKIKITNQTVLRDVWNLIF